MKVKRALTIKRNKRTTHWEQINNLANPYHLNNEKTQGQIFQTTKKLPIKNEPCPCGSGKKFKHCTEHL
jgi:uncharacterized protein YecA (UPF0149 family)